MFKKALQDFKASRSDLFLFKQLDAPRVCVLDSSFNPPHLGHLAIVNESLCHYKDVAVLLLLLLKNADKADAPAAFEQRLAMMAAMAREIETRGVAVGLGLTTHAKFVDKAAALSRLCSGRLTFLVGFDTLVRILDKKYYRDFDAELSQFRATSLLFCVTRDGEASHEEQVRYVEQLGFADVVDVVRGSDYALVSSTELRRGKREGLLPEVRNYIEQNGLYD